MTFYIWLKHKRFIFNITLRHFTDVNEIELFLYPNLFYFTS